MNTRLIRDVQICCLFRENQGFEHDIEGRKQVVSRIMYTSLISEKQDKKSAIPHIELVPNSFIYEKQSLYAMKKGASIFLSALHSFNLLSFIAGIWCQFLS
jgi:hypothetical protein